MKPVLSGAFSSMSRTCGAGRRGSIFMFWLERYLWFWAARARRSVGFRSKCWAPGCPHQRTGFAPGTCGREIEGLPCRHCAERKVSDYEGCHSANYATNRLASARRRSFRAPARRIRLRDGQRWRIGPHDGEHGWHISDNGRCPGQKRRHEGDDGRQSQFELGWGFLEQRRRWQSQQQRRYRDWRRHTSLGRRHR